MLTPLIAWIRSHLPRKQAAVHEEADPSPIGLSLPREELPSWVSTCPTAMRYYDLFSLMPWNRLSNRMPKHPLHGDVVGYNTLCAAMLVRVEEGLVSTGHPHPHLSSLW